MSKATFALIDCNNFYASCERVFNPALKDKPVVILSNNDGCVIARSNEAKKLGIPMGAPYFKFAKIMHEQHVHVLSSNYTVYGDMSSRVMKLLSNYTPNFEVYSIDEAFLRLDSLPTKDYFSLGLKIRKEILQATGLPVSVGIAPTKTLAKVANFIAKKRTASGVFQLDALTQDDLFASLAIEEVWGVGHRIGKKLREMNIESALDLKRTDVINIRKHFNVVLAKTVYELNGIACLDLEETAPKKSITSSRSFGEKLTEKMDLSQAVAGHCARACEKLRQQQGLAHALLVFIKTSPFDERQAFYSHSTVVSFPVPLNDTGLIIKAANSALSKIYRPNLRYSKVGVTLLDIVDESTAQLDIWETSPNRIKLMQVLDKVNQKFQKRALFYAAEGTEKKWQMRRDKKTPAYTSSWQELAIAYAH